MPTVRPLRTCLLGACALLVCSAAAAAPPDEGECPTISATPEEVEYGHDAAPVALKEGMLLDHDALLVLRRLMPPEIWRHREVFFFEGMRMEVGACHRRYPDPGFYKEATEKFAGKARLDGEGNLLDYTAGVPFPPESFDAKAKDAGLRWAWNMEMRYRGAGHRGKFRLADLPTALGGVLFYEGQFFLIQTRHRADLAEQGYAVPGGDGLEIAAGGRLDRPFDARHLAWRQFRSSEVRQSYSEPDDVFVYVPSMRKTRRAASTWVDGVFFPRYSATGDAGGGGMAFGGGTGVGGSINPTGGQSAAASEDARRGFTGMLLRPNAYVWRSRGERDVLAPLNVNADGWPVDPERNFGPSGLSIASDRWDVRRVVVIDGKSRQDDEDVGFVTIYLDYQTRQPLFWITRTRGNRLLEIGVLAYRFTNDVREYAEWPGGVPAQVMEPVAALFYNAISGGGGWRRESYALLSLPYPEDERERMLTASALDRGR